MTRAAALWVDEVTEFLRSGRRLTDQEHARFVWLARQARRQERAERRRRAREQLAWERDWQRRASRAYLHSWTQPLDGDWIDAMGDDGMAYARFGDGGSSVYVYANSDDRLICCGCLLQESDDDWVEFTTADMLVHLDAHVAAGHTVPADVAPALMADHANGRLA